MQTITIAIKNTNAIQILNDLEEKKFISIIENTEMDLPVFTGKQLKLDEFRNWVNAAENTSVISIEEAKAVWKTKRDQLQKIIA